MNHLSDDLIYTLAVKVTDDAALTSSEEDALMHITECDQCYHMLRATMAMLQASQSLGNLVVEQKPAEDIQSVHEPIRAVLKLAVGAVNSVLDQITAGANAWSFRSAPALLTGLRTSQKRSPIQKVTDLQNRKNFVAYDPNKKLLMIQLDASEYSAPPEAFLTLSDGTEEDIVFERRDDVFRAEIAGLEEDDYEITLEK